MSRKFRFVTLAIAFILMLSPALSLTAQARDASIDPAAPKNKDVVSMSMNPAQQKAALDSWTHEALAAAQPAPLMVDSGASGAALGAEPAAITGAPGAAPSGAPDANADQVAQAAYPSDWAALAASDSPADAIPTGTSQVFDSYVLNQYSQLWNIYPHKWVGRLSFRNPSGSTFYCSATAISGNVMLTAAHCVYDTTNNFFYNSWVFTPAYRAGSAPFGSFPARTCWVLTNWVNYSGSYSLSWAANDVAVCKMGTNSAGQTLNGAVGFMGRLWNGGYTYLYNDMGYPFQDTSLNYIPNAGAYSWDCVAESRYYTTNVLSIGCDRGPGFSGGPWTVNYAPFQVRGWANGVNSGIIVGQNNIYAGRFTDQNIVPLCNAAVC